MISSNLDRLFPLEEEDLSPVAEWLTDSHIYRNLYTLYRPLPRRDLEEWYDDEISRGAHIFRYATDDERFTAMALVHYIHPKNHCGEISFIVNPGMQGKGHARRVLRSLLEYCFGVLNLNKVFFHTTAYNSAMCHIASTAGLVHEGTFRKEIFFDGEYHNILRYGILAEEFGPE